jgi:hypothetical protein
VQAEAVDQLLTRVLDLAGLLAALALPPAELALIGPALSVVKKLLLEDIEGLRETAEELVWRTISDLVTQGLIEAGAGETTAKTLVAALREAARPV